MIRHLLKLVWHRKRANALVMAEIFLCFLVVFAVATLGVSLLARWRSPLGFSWRDVWVVQVDRNRPSTSGTRTTGPPPDEIADAANNAAEVVRLLREIKSFAQVEAVAADAMTPFAERTWDTVMTTNGRGVPVMRDQASDDYARAMQIPLLRGRWFSREDDGQDYAPLVIDADAARAMFGDADPVGQKFASYDGGPRGSTSEFRVVGLIPPYRKDGELSSPKLEMVFSRLSLSQSGAPDLPDGLSIVVRVRPGTPAVFESEMSNRLHSAAPNVRFRVRRMDEMRSLALRIRMLPLAALSLIAIFLIGMVALGLTGVLWQSVTRRMHEIGIRRAAGASGRAVRAQIFAEVALLTTLAVIAGVVIVLQLPLLGVFGLVTPAELAAGLFAALAVIYALTLLCGAYPSWLASVVEPAEALRCE
ncbi:MAG TPA: ABC transporter permease [Thermoanaerobaculia bacterium]|nr:ABC transporter permease [Thermoanaerobaculia bacterium]